MVGVQMGQQDVDVVGVGVALQGAEHTAAEIEDKRRGVRRGQQVAGRRRIRSDNTAGATKDGDSHSH
ncbi:hypothetical protein MSZK_46480 [Mycobacterium sp. shizuoka-1]|nr:hypothetical protein MSZK_46480 [Mycobacterium sp. shizuoka-1]